ncbi:MULTISPECIES: PTS sugar transporter subunit IIA [Salimicrobium]|uniref:PTS glucose transporter subunit IIA n=3 Tax=Salimicrobium TaxID=351195 RepID=K2GCA0_9BACI|nr:MULTISPECIES: PTS glucose transporter subunit IIA [Salimicrobium]AKG03647.1 PTS glucose transporter subunit IIA [Salimicrobium jeotgali]EKE31932.1 PTS system subunit IIA, glucose-specific [Salimicrobium jeotgali]MBM7696116.1 PTS system glucose-specific IIA component [Salimicrobium jeotgali]SDX82975.1 PTS system, glucose-specific IIA component [Salimicrobium album]SIS80837.1 PTS system IIA component, Glc family [Salimicrobium salexigens]
MFKKLFGKEDKNISIVAPVNGKVVALDEVPDPVFSQRMMGDGMAIEPSDGKVVSPVDGEIVQIFPTNHAVGVKTSNGLEILVHIGLETVSMEGEGFEGHVSQGDKVKTGDPLVTFDKDLVAEKAKAVVTPVVITNYDDAVESFEVHQTENATAGETVIASVTAK